jgi:hypothetical protein
MPQVRDREEDAVPSPSAPGLTFIAAQDDLRPLLRRDMYER